MLRGLCDFHIGENISGITVDMPRYFDQLQRMGINVLTFMTKDAMGTSYYHTNVGHRNVHITSDFLAEAVEQAHKRRMQLVAYYNASLDDRLDSEHPDWQQIDANGEAPYVLRQYTAFCMNTPYRDRVRGQLEELVSNYDTDGIWLDITYIFDGRCYCEYCRRLYRDRYDTPIPEAPAPGSVDMRRLKKFRRDCRREFLEDFVGTVRAIRGPEFSVGWNHAGDVAFCQAEVDRHASYFSVEFHAPNYQRGLYETAWMRPFGKPIELMMPECLAGWGEWTVLPTATLKSMGAVALAVGAELCVGHVPLPSGPASGALAEPVATHFGELLNWLKPRARVCKGARPLATAAVVTPAVDQHLLAARNDTWLERPGTGVEGAHRLLTETHHHVDLLNEDTLENIEQYELVVLPDTAHVPQAVLDALRAYVEAGGILIVDGTAGARDENDEVLTDFSIAQLTGTHCLTSSSVTSRYFDCLADTLGADVPDMPILVRSQTPIANIEADDGCEVLARFTDPEYEAQPRRHIYHQHGHPAVPTEQPAITRRRVGKGWVAHIAAPLCSDYAAHGDPALRMLMHNLIHALNPDPLVQLSAPPSVRMALMQTDDQLLVHLLHWHIDHTCGPAFVETELPVPGLQLSIRDERPVRIQQIDHWRRDLPFEHKAGRTTIDLDPLNTHAIIAIDRQSQPALQATPASHFKDGQDATTSG